MTNKTRAVDPAEIDIAIKMLKQYVKEISIEPVISILEDLKQTPGEESLIVDLAKELDNLGVTKGAVLTYAPYIGLLMSYDLFGND